MTPLQAPLIGRVLTGGSSWPLRHRRTTSNRDVSWLQECSTALKRGPSCGASNREKRLRQGERQVRRGAGLGADEGRDVGSPALDLLNRPSAQDP
jgi:hypothetical protein